MATLCFQGLHSNEKFTLQPGPPVSWILVLDIYNPGDKSPNFNFIYEGDINLFPSLQDSKDFSWMSYAQTS